MNTQQYKPVYLSDLSSNDQCVITKVHGHGAFRKRITEMGFVKGKKVSVIKNAPLQDPIEYEIMGYRVTLRRSEAQLIEVISMEQSKSLAGNIFEGTFTEERMMESFAKTSKIINIALVGNPNCGKTTLFNFATGKHEKVGNYGGVTVDIKEAYFTKNNYTLNVTDLPGTYSISEYSPEELYVRKHISENMPDVVVNVIDASNLERNLFLTTQLIDMNIKVVIALNMYDELEKKGDTFDYEALGKMIGIPILTTVAAKGKGIDELFTKVIDIYEDSDPIARHTHINYGHELEESIRKVKNLIKSNSSISHQLCPRYLAIKLLENENSTRNYICQFQGGEEVVQCAKTEMLRLEKIFEEKTETIITDAKYGFIHGALKETYQPKEITKQQISHAVDTILTHKFFGFPVFIFFLWATFQMTFSLGSYPMNWIDSGVSFLSDLLKNSMNEGPLRDLLVDGIIGGVGGVIVFLPNILILFFCISLMEDTGYMARAAFIMDKLMHKIGLHGKSFIPLIMGFGCNVPAVMATRTLENRKDRILTMLILPLMSCSARLPVYVLLISAFFPQNQGIVLLSIYLAGIVLAVLVALLFKKIFFAKKDVPFVMELPPYRIPTLRNTSIHMWGKSVQYLTKMGTIILTASILIWALGYYPHNVKYSKNYASLEQSIQNNPQLNDRTKQIALNELQVSMQSERLEQSYIGKIGHFIEPVIRPLGFDWKIGVSIVTGLAAKEIVVGTMGVLYQSGLDDNETSVSLKSRLQEQVHSHGDHIGQKVFTPLVAYGFMLFVLVYFPCVAVIAAVKKEAGIRWALFTMFYTTTIAWLIAFATYQIGGLF